MIITTEAELAALSTEQIESLAQASLTWERRHNWSMSAAKGISNFSNYIGHAQFKTRGYPGRFDSHTFDSREAYLRYRLAKKLRLKSTHGLADAEGIKELEMKKKAERKKQAAERAKKSLVKPLGITVTIAASAEIEEFMGTKKESPVRFKVWTGENMNRHGTPYPKKGVWQWQRASSSPSNRICTQNAAFVGKDAIAAVKFFSELDETKKKLKEIMGQLTLPESVRISGVHDLAKKDLGEFYIDDLYNSSTVSLKPITVDGVECVRMTAQHYSFQFKITDFLALEDALGRPDDYEVVKKEKSKKKVAA